MLPASSIKLDNSESSSQQDSTSRKSPIPKFEVELSAGKQPPSRLLKSRVGSASLKETPLKSGFNKFSPSKFSMGERRSKLVDQFFGGQDDEQEVYLGKRVDVPCDLPVAGYDRSASPVVGHLENDLSEQAERALADEIVAQELLDVDFDTFSQMASQGTHDPLEYFSYKTARVDNRFTALQPVEFDSEPPLAKLSEMTAKMQQILTFVQASEMKKTSNNKMGYHIIIGAEALQKFFNRYRDLEICCDSSTLVTMFGAESTWQVRGLFIHMQRFITWLTFAASPAFTRFYKKVLETEIIERELLLKRLGTRFELDGLWNELQKRIKVQTILCNSHSLLWSMEGVSRYSGSDSLKFLHFHLIVQHKSSINSNRWEFVSAAFKKIFGSEITIRALMSHNQILYIFKEKFCVGITSVSGLVDHPKISIWNTSSEYFGDLIEKVGSFAFKNGNIGAVCSLCNQVPENARAMLGCRYGWDYKLTNYLFESQDVEFLTSFKNVKEYESFVSLNQEYGPFCTMKLRSMVALRRTMLSNYFTLYGVTSEETDICINLILKAFNAFIEGLQIQQRRLYDVIVAWIAANIINSDTSTWKSILLLGGQGGSGKTTVATYLMRSIGANVTSHSFDTSNPGREALTPENPIRFYDEAPTNKISGRNIFFEFQHFEKNQSAIYSTNSKKKALEFTSP